MDEKHGQHFELFLLLFGGGGGGGEIASTIPFSKVKLI